ncbi:MAG: Arm DNA-binding domain-containing protein, partial [Chloroflexota bacterium]|nr:Arm DNA-binding domain-containing protein [Chloroflexota bacterium]
MAIVERLDGDGKRRWQVRIATRDADGKRKNRTVGTYSTKKAAQKAERDALTMRDSGTLVNASTATVAEVLD